MNTPAQDVSDQCLGAAFREAIACSNPNEWVEAVGVTWLLKRARELQQAQVVGGKIANGHHCGLPEYLCKHPSHTPQSSAPAPGGE